VHRTSGVVKVQVPGLAVNRNRIAETGCFGDGAVVFLKRIENFLLEREQFINGSCHAARQLTVYCLKNITIDDQ